MKLLSILLLLLIFGTYCNGQDKTQPKHSAGKPITIHAGNPKMVKTQGAKYGNVYCRLQDKGSNLWFATDGEGVYRYDGKSFTNFTEKDGLSSNYVSAIIQDKAGSILLGTNNGICKYDGTSFKNFTEKDGLVLNYVFSAFEDKAGNLWFGTREFGLSRYDGKTFTTFSN